MTVTDLFNKYKGTMEYTGIVETIQKWYYGELLNAEDSRALIME